MCLGGCCEISPALNYPNFMSVEPNELEGTTYASEALLGEIVDAIPALVWTAGNDGHAKLFNRRWLDYTGFSREQAEGWGWLGSVHPEDRERIAERWRTSFGEEKDFEVEAQFRRHDGEYRWFLCKGVPQRDNLGKVISWFGSNTDIEDLKRAEGRLRTNGQDFHQIMDGLPGMVTTMDGKGTLEFVNRKTYEYFGKTFEQLKNWTGDNSVHPDDLPRVVETWMKAVKEGAAYEAKQRLRSGNSTYRWFTVYGSPQFNDAGQVVRWYTMILDIDDQKKAEEALQRARESLINATKITTMAELAASIAHEVNQPLAAVVTNAETCLRWLNASPPNQQEAHEALLRIIRDGNRGGEIVTRIRSLYKKDGHLIARVNVNETIKEVFQLVFPMLGKVHLSLKLDPDLPHVGGDRLQIQQVLINLVTNALDAMKSIGDRACELRIETAWLETQEVKVAVADSGHGIKPDALERLFDPFYSTKLGGLGMGLSICRTIVEEHGGRIWAESGKLPGSIFQFTLLKYTNLSQ